jgi:hypothetical protein
MEMRTCNDAVASTSRSARSKGNPENVATGNCRNRRAKEVRELWTLALVIVGLCFLLRVPASGMVLLASGYGNWMMYHELPPLM